MKPKGVTPYPVMVRGQVFPSAKACAEHFGLSAYTVRELVNEGRADSIGIGRGNWKRPTKKEKRKT